ncbi:MAG: ribose 5-phosphate isomerase A [Legionellales bacterium]|nr:ribose 5-phosphate isomerase A [Legionellales bacterium]
MANESLKQQVATAALKYIKDDMTIGIGTGTTVHYFIEGLKNYRHRIDAVVASSIDTQNKLKNVGIPVVEMTSVNQIDLYVDGADEVNPHKQLIKGGGGALTREKIIAYNSKQFICIVDETKCVDILGQFPLPIEVIPMARSIVARALVQLGGNPVYRENFITDNQNIILDVNGLDIMQPIALEGELNQIPGVVSNGLFAQKTPQTVLVAKNNGITEV